MEELFSRLASKDITAMVVLSLMLIAGVVVWLSLQWRLHRRSEMEAALKQQMLDRGMSADEIVRVIQATPGGSAVEPERVPPGNGVRSVR